MPQLNGLTKKVAMALPGKPSDVCQCHRKDFAPWTGEIHGLSQALESKSWSQRVFWCIVLLVCILCGTYTTVLVVLEYIQGPTATSTTIKVVDTLELPALTICPKVPDAFNFTGILKNIRSLIPHLDEDTCRDLIAYFVAGSGLENMDEVPYNNASYNRYLSDLFNTWSRGYSPGDFFHIIQTNYGYQCQDFLVECQLGGKTYDCCKDLFRPKPVMRRGLCYETVRNVNQTEADDIGRLVVLIGLLPSVTSRDYNFTQPQTIIYVNDNWDWVIDFPRYYLYPNEWNRMHFSATYIDLLEHPTDCTNKIFGKDAFCFVRNWLYSNVFEPFNCTIPYLPGIVNHTSICAPDTLVPDYYNTIQLVHSGSMTTHDCIPGCRRWEYTVSLQQSAALSPFEGHTFNFEVSYYDLQYENVKEVYTTSVPGFMSQIGGQFGFFLGLSIITMIQILISTITFLVTFCFSRIQKIIGRRKIALVSVPLEEEIMKNGF
ncbi:hypothetical protein FO519_005929 [Halicephalobus sp. NKZ332]|nr:hypothetical protein FO519_005929 [Halicephalobus sp. NKZ332]